MKVLKDIIGYFFSLYFLVALVGFAPYYNWEYAKTHGFMSWILWGEVRATGKALAFPYFVLTNSDQTPLHVKRALNYKYEALNILKEDEAYQTVNPADMERIVAYYRQALDEAKKADIQLMNKHYQDFGDHFRQQFIMGLELFIQSYEEKDINKSLKSYELLKEWDVWYRNNSKFIRNK